MNLLRILLKVDTHWTPHYTFQPSLHLSKVPQDRCNERDRHQLVVEMISDRQLEVFVYKLIVANTIEQKILEMQERKRKLQDSIYDGDKQQDDIKFSGNDLLKLLE